MTRGFFFFKQKTAYEMRISDWSSDVCSSDLLLFSTALFGIALVLLFVAGRPGHELGKRWLWLLMPPAVVAISAVTELSMATPPQREAMWLGSTWQTCVAAIALLSLPVFAGVL